MVRNIFTCGLAVLLMVGLSFSMGPKCANAKVIGAWLLDGDGADSSGNGNDGVLTGDPGWVNGKFGQAMRAEASKYIDFPPPTSDPMMLDGDYTCMAWVNPNEWVSGWNCVFSMQGGSTNGETYGIYFGNETPGTEIFVWAKLVGGTQNLRTGPGTLELNEWTHAAATYDGSKITIYKNGEVAAEGDFSGALDNADGKGRFAINGNYNSLDGGLAEWCSAAIDEVLVFDAALTVGEIRDYMNKGYSGVVGGTTAVEPSVKLAVTWGGLKASQ